MRALFTLNCTSEREKVYTRYTRYLLNMLSVHLYFGILIEGNYCHNCFIAPIFVKDIFLETNILLKISQWSSELETLCCNETKVAGVQIEFLQDKIRVFDLLSIFTINTESLLKIFINILKWESFGVTNIKLQK